MRRRRLAGERAADGSSGTAGWSKGILQCLVEPVPAYPDRARLG